jgi:hypothetical protein
MIPAGRKPPRSSSLREKIPEKQAISMAQLKKSPNFPHISIFGPARPRSLKNTHGQPTP